MKFEKRKLIIEIEKRTLDKKTGHISFQFQIGPFKKTMGTTVGAALRRTLLSLTKSVNITSACGKFYDGNCLREDLFELSLNLQKINIKSSFFPYIGTAKIKKVGPAIITAQDLQLEEGLEIINPYQYICSINEGYTFELMLMISSTSVNQSLSYTDPSATFIKTKHDALRYREKDIFPIPLKKSQKFLENLEGYIVKSKILKSIGFNQQISSKTEKITNSSPSKGKSLTNDINSLKRTNPSLIGGPQKLPFDIIMVDPIYSAIQSCGFEITQTIKSSVVEYDDLIKRGIAQTEEFLRFVVISRGTIEPAFAIQLAVEELRETLSIMDTLSHLFTNDKAPLVDIRKSNPLYENFRTRKDLLHSFTDQLMGHLDISHLNLPIRLELLLRRQGFVTLQNLRTVPLEFLKRVGLETNDIKAIKKSLDNLGLSTNLDEELVWDLIPQSIPKL